MSIQALWSAIKALPHLLDSHREELLWRATCLDDHTSNLITRMSHQISAGAEQAVLETARQLVVAEQEIRYMSRYGRFRISKGADITKYHKRITKSVLAPTKHGADVDVRKVVWKCWLECDHTLLLLARDTAPKGAVFCLHCGGTPYWIREEMSG